MNSLLTLETYPTKDSFIYAKFTGHEFKKVHWYKKNKLYFQIECNYNDSNCVTILKSHPSKDMDFYPFQLLYSKIRAVTDDPKVPIRIRFYDFANNLKEGKIVGECYTDIETLKNSVGGMIPLTKVRKDGLIVDVGSFIVDSFRVSELSPFTEYVKHGLKFHVAVAIDFFYENDKFYKYLHKEGKENNYEQVLSAALEVLMPYSYGDSIASYALGYSYKGKFRLCGNLTLDDSELFLHGPEEVISTYKKSIKKVSCSGASWFAPMIEETSQLARTNFKNFKAYTIVLIVTCGKIENKMETIESLNKASLAPISFIFINIGPYNEMEWIDADDKPLTGSNTVQARDCVDYIFYKNVVDNKLNLDHEMMKEIPNHVSVWANLNNICPDYFSS